MPTATSQVVSQLQRSIARAIYGKEEAIQLALITLLARGHLLIEDVPGVGKTTLAQALAKSFHCSFQRVQFTSDLLPSDVPAASRIAAMLVRHCRVCSWIVVAPIWPVAGSVGAVPETNTSPAALTAWL